MRLPMVKYEYVLYQIKCLSFDYNLKKNACRYHYRCTHNGFLRSIYIKKKLKKKHASQYYMHCAWTCTCSRNAWIKTIQRQPPPKMLRLIQNQWIWPSLTLTCLQAHVVALQELHKAMSRWICLFFNSISKFLNLSFYQNCRKVIVLRFWEGKTSNTTIATCNCNSRNLPLGPLCP